MTNEEALEILDTIPTIGEQVDALEIAIKALEQQQNIHDTCKKCVEFSEFEQQPCEDCISRTRLLARIDEERKHLLDIKMDGAEHIIVHHARRIIEDMPSVNPEGENFTDEEKRIFLASVAREMRVCEQIDSENTKVKLVPILERVKDKVLRSSLWKEVEE